MKKFKTVYVCDNCGAEDENPQLYREVYGNVCVPEGGGLIGNNIWNIAQMPASIKEAIEKNMMPIGYQSADTVVAGMTFCLKCYIKMVLNSTGVNFNKAVNKQERAILTSILSEISNTGSNKASVTEYPDTSNPVIIDNDIASANNIDDNESKQ